MAFIALQRDCMRKCQDHMMVRRTASLSCMMLYLARPSRQEAEEHDRAMDALESALEDARSAARSKEQKLVIATKELKARPLRTL